MQKLRGKLSRNLGLGWVAFLKKGFFFAGATVSSRYWLRGANKLGLGIRVRGVAPRIDNPGGTLVVGDDVVFSAPVTATYLGLKPGAFLSIGDETWVNDAVWLEATTRITIGRRVLLGPGVRIFDNHHHDLYARRRTPAGRAVTLEDDVWVASDAIIFPGVTIGRGAVVAAGSIVHDDVQPFSVVAGNPARQVKTLDPERFELPD